MGIHYPEITHLCDECNQPTLETLSNSEIRWTPIVLSGNNSNDGSWLCFSCYSEEVDNLKKETFDNLKLLSVYLAEYEKKAEAKNETKKT